MREVREERKRGEGGREEIDNGIEKGRREKVKRS